MYNPLPRYINKIIKLKEPSINFCNKKWYLDKETAQKSIDTILKSRNYRPKLGQYLRTYFCSQCSVYHFGHANRKD